MTSGLRIFCSECGHDFNSIADGDQHLFDECPGAVLQFAMNGRCMRYKPETHKDRLLEVYLEQVDAIRKEHGGVSASLLQRKLCVSREMAEKIMEKVSGEK